MKPVIKRCPCTCHTRSKGAPPKFHALACCSRPQSPHYMAGKPEQFNKAQR